MGEHRDIDLLDGNWYLDGAHGPGGDFAWLRDHAPLYWDAGNELWSVARYDDIVDVERRKDTFTSADRTKGGYRPNIPADPALIGMDDPDHHERRNLVSRRFTPKAIKAWEPEIRAKVTRLLDAVETGGGSAEVVSSLAAPLPAMMIGKLLGFPDDAWPQLVDWSERTIAGGGGPRYLTDDTILAAMDFAQAAADLYDAKQGCPADDVMSVWTGATGKPPLERDTVISDSLLLLDGGAETTRTVIARGLLLFIEHPGEWEKLRAGADLTVATEELIRYITPIHNMCRVALEDAPVAGGVVPAGHQVVMLYGAANRDPAHFEDPDRFDVTRGHNNHIAFGFGTHFCLGAALARLEIAVFFEELARRVRSLQLTPGTAPVDMPNAFVNGLASAHLDLEFA
jgi:cytochrome P450 family 142 subfamily A polypeptide 1